MSSSNIARKERRKKQTRLTFDPIAAEVPSGSPIKDQGPSPAKVRYEKMNDVASASSGRVTRSGTSLGSPLKVKSSVKGKSGKKKNGKISFGSLPTPAKSSQKDDAVKVDTGIGNRSRRSTRGSQKAELATEEATALAEESTIEAETKTPSRNNKRGSAATENPDDVAEVEITSSGRKDSANNTSRRRSFTGRGFIQGGSTYNAPLPTSGNRGRAPKALVDSPKPLTPSKSTPKKRSVILSDTSDDDVFTSISKPKALQRPGMFSQKLAASIQSSDESSEEADVDSEDDILPSSTRRRQAQRVVPQIALQDDEDDPDDEPPTSPMKRKRPTIISDDEDSDLGLAVKKKKLVDESGSDNDLPPMPKQFKATPESKNPDSPPNVKRKVRSPKKHRTAKQKQLEILRRKRAGESNPVLTDSESEEDEEARGLYDSGNDALSTFEDEEDEEAEEEVQETRKRKSPKKPAVRENEDEYDSDFVDDDDHGLLGIPDYAMIPLEFTAAAHKPLKEHFSEAVEWCVQKKINPGFNQNLMPIYKSAWNKLEDAYSGLTGSKFVSTSWTRDFTKALYARPEFVVRRLGPGEAIDLLGETRCEACNRRKHVPTWGIQLRGSTYYKDSLAEVEKDDSSTDDDEEEDDSGDEKDTRSLNSRDEPLPPQDKEYMVGA